MVRSTMKVVQDQGKLPWWGHPNVSRSQQNIQN